MQRTSYFSTYLAVVLTAAIFFPHLAFALDLLPLTASQKLYNEDAAKKNRNASDAARNAGKNSMNKGANHMKHGRHHHQPSMTKQGSFEIAQGLLGLLGSAAAQQMADKDSSNASKLDQAPVKAGASVLGGVSGSSQSDNSGVAGSTNFVNFGKGKLEASDVADPEVKEALALVQDEYGIPAKEFIAELANGKSSTSLFVNAPENPMSPEDAGIALADALAANPELKRAAASAVTPAIPAAKPVAAISPATKGVIGNTKDYSLRDALTKKLQEGEIEQTPEMSAEVKAAMAAKEAEEHEAEVRQGGGAEPDLFEQVHRRYKSREETMRWGGISRP